MDVYETPLGGVIDFTSMATICGLLGQPAPESPDDRHDETFARELDNAKFEQYQEEHGDDEE